MNATYALRLFVRNLMRRKLFALLNITGLAFGIAFIILIGQYLYIEFGHNRIFKNVDQIYRLVNTKDNNYGIDYRVRDTIVENIPGIKNAALYNTGPTEVNYGDRVYEFDALAVCDENFLNMFGLRFVAGSAENALNTIESLVLTESTSRRIFGEQDPLGQILIVGHKEEMMVTGIVKDMPENTSFRAEMFASFENSPNRRLSYYINCMRHDGKEECRYPFNIFVELQDNVEASVVAQQIPGLFNSDDFRFPNEVSLTALKTDYLDTRYQDYSLLHGNIKLLRILSWIGVIILCLAVINFVNLTTASYKHRLIEIGVKKCLGVSKWRLRRQLIIESFGYCLCAALLGVVIAEIFLPYFNEYVEKPLQIQVFSNLNFSIMFAGFIILLSLLAGLAPAYILSRISPLRVFRLGSDWQGSGKTYRSILTVFQFGVSVTLICSLLVMSKQIDYVKGKDLGFDTEQLISLRIDREMGMKTKALTDKLRQHHGIKSLTLTNSIPGNVRTGMDDFAAITVDSSSMKTFGFKVIDGRDLLPGDFGKACLVNAAGLSKFETGDFRGQEVNGNEVVGVVSDFHYGSLHRQTGALALVYSDWGGVSHISIRLTGPVSGSIDYIKKIWQEICPDFPLNLQFYDEAFAAMYRKEENLATLISIFSVLAIVISCMGIFGLAVFQSEQKVKEIGVRKVLGATTAEITVLLTKNFTRWVILANIVAWPAAYYTMTNWLQSFAYRIELNWWMFALAGGIALVIALFTISFQAMKTAMANPVDSLRYE